MSRSISVIIPCYNAGAYIREAVDSVLRQDGKFDLVDVIIVNDRSDDEVTKTALKDLAALDKVRILENMGPRGPAAARNTGIERAAGEWIAFLDADDVMTEESISVRMEALERFPDCGWVGGDALIWHGGDSFETETFFRSRPIPKDLLHEAFREERPILLKRPVREFLLSGLTNTCASLVRKDLLARISSFDETLRMQQDYHLFLRLASVSDFVFVPKVVMFYRQHGANLTGNESTVREWRIKGLRKLLEESATFARYKNLIWEKVGNLYLSNSYDYRKSGLRGRALSAAVSAIVVNPRNLRAWRAVVAAAVAR